MGEQWRWMWGLEAMNFSRTSWERARQLRKEIILLMVLGKMFLFLLGLPHFLLDFYSILFTSLFIC